MTSGGTPARPLAVVSVVSHQARRSLFTILNVLTSTSLRLCKSYLPGYAYSDGENRNESGKTLIRVPVAIVLCCVGQLNQCLVRVLFMVVLSISITVCADLDFRIIIRVNRVMLLGCALYGICSITVVSLCFLVVLFISSNYIITYLLALMLIEKEQ